MKPIQFYKYAMLALIALNLVLIGFFFFKRPPRHHMEFRHEARERMADKKHRKPLHRIDDLLQLDEKQKTQLRALARSHRKQMMALDSQYKERLMACFRNISDTDTISGQAINDVLKLEQKKLETTYKHFQDVKSMLSEEQKTNFDVFVEKVLRHVLPQKGLHRRMGKDLWKGQKKKHLEKGAE